MQTPSSNQSNLTPEFIPMPSRGGDPLFSLSRSAWYNLEVAGLIQFVRVRRPGQVRGKVLIPVAKAREVIAGLAERAAKSAARN